MALGMAGLTQRRTRWRPTVAPGTCRSSLKSEASPCTTSRNSTGSPWSRLWSSRAWPSLRSYSSSVNRSGRWAMMRTPCGATSSMALRAASSRVTFSTRSSVERMARESIEVATMPTMNRAAILMPSGRSITMLTMV